MNLHARYQQHLQRSPVERGPARPEARVPQLKNRARPAEAGAMHGSGNRPGARREHVRIVENERQQPRAPVEGGDDDRRQLRQLCGTPLQATFQRAIRAGSDEAVRSLANGKLHSRTPLSSARRLCASGSVRCPIEIRTGGQVSAEGTEEMTPPTI